MNRDPVAVVSPAIDIAAIRRRVCQAHVALQDAERGEEAANKVAESARDEAARRRLELGRALVEARKAWPARGPRAKGWGDFLRDSGIEQDAALRWMALAGHVADHVSRTGEDVREIPTVREVQEARRQERIPEEVKKTTSEPVEDLPDDAEEAPVATMAPTPPVVATAILPREQERAAPQNAMTPAVLSEIERLADDVDKKASALQSATKRLEQMLRQYEASIGGPKIALTRAAIVRAYGTVQECARLTGGTDESQE